MATFNLYQVLPRTLGNGTFSELDATALKSIASLGMTHIWLTGVLEHATQTDYSPLGMPADHPAMVKGKAGSPYAIRDYYDIDPDLADDPARRMSEFEALIQRCHKQKLSVIIDFVPNHVARVYRSDAAPDGVRDFGADDNVQTAFDRDNNFYYIPNQALEPQFDTYAGRPEPYREFPAKVTGNDCFHHRPQQNDWYETVKLNYGVDYHTGQTHFDPIPSTWKKMRDILLYWAAKGVDGFRCDMAEMVPVAFWEWVIPEVKAIHPELIFIAEVYQPHLYEAYIRRGGFDYLYDKVGTYDCLRGILEGHRRASELTQCWQQVNHVLPHMLYFLENHDEQRIASDFFAGDPKRALPALALMSFWQANPVMIYAGQEWGERGMEAEGFSGLDGRTSIFDYCSPESLRKWKSGGRWDGSEAEPEARELRAAYARMLGLRLSEPALREGRFYDLTYANEGQDGFDSSRHFAFLRATANERILVVVNFSSDPATIRVRIPAHAFDYFGWPSTERATAVELLSGKRNKLVFMPDVPIECAVPSCYAQAYRMRTTQAR